MSATIRRRLVPALALCALLPVAAGCAHGSGPTQGEAPSGSAAPEAAGAAPGVLGDGSGPEDALPPQDAPLDDDALLDDELFGDVPDAADRDPYERTNRGFFRANLHIEKYLLDPISTGYGWLVPAPGRRAVYRFFLNLNSASVLVNDLLQLRPKRAGVTVSRFVINTTLGVVGLLDVAKWMGLQRHHADFGQTMARAGVPSGPYLVLPLFGPSTARNAFGDLADGLFQPYFYILGPTPTIVLSAGSGFSLRDANKESIEALREMSVDYYAAMRSAYFMYREHLILDGR